MLWAEAAASVWLAEASVNTEVALDKAGLVEAAAAGVAGPDKGGFAELGTDWARGVEPLAEPIETETEPEVTSASAAALCSGVVLDP